MHAIITGHLITARTVHVKSKLNGVESEKLHCEYDLSGNDTVFDQDKSCIYTVLSQSTGAEAEKYCDILNSMKFQELSVEVKTRSWADKKGNVRNAFQERSVYHVGSPVWKDSKKAL